MELDLIGCKGLDQIRKRIGDRSRGRIKFAFGELSSIGKNVQSLLFGLHQTIGIYVIRKLDGKEIAGRKVCRCRHLNHRIHGQGLGLVGINGVHTIFHMRRVPGDRIELETASHIRSAHDGCIRILSQHDMDYLFADDIPVRSR